MIAQVILSILAFTLIIAVMIFLGREVGNIEKRRKLQWYKFMEISVLDNLIDALNQRIKKYPLEAGREKELIERVLVDLKDDYKKEYGDYFLEK